MNIIIQENQRGLLFRNGKFQRLLKPGRFSFLTNVAIEVCSITEELKVKHNTIETLLRHEKVKDELVDVQVGDEQLALHFVNGRYLGCYLSGVHAFWKADQQHDFQLVDISNPEVSTDIARYILDRLPGRLLIKATVADYEVARLYYDQKLEKILQAGVYYFWNTKTSVTIERVDQRIQSLDMCGQEILTKDKVTLRINFHCQYRIRDLILIKTEWKDYEEQLYTVAQLALRSCVGELRLDELLEQKDRISNAIFTALKAKEQQFYLEIYNAGIKDIILPGEIRDIMNTVLVAEKAAQANVITRREEVASTRSLLNTAKLMEDNPTLYRLKQLEYAERIAARVGGIQLSGQGDILTQITALLERKES